MRDSRWMSSMVRLQSHTRHLSLSSKMMDSLIKTMSAAIQNLSSQNSRSIIKGMIRDTIIKMGMIIVANNMITIKILLLLTITTKATPTIMIMIITITTIKEAMTTIKVTTMIIINIKTITTKNLNKPTLKSKRTKTGTTQLARPSRKLSHKHTNKTMLTCQLKTVPTKKT